MPHLFEVKCTKGSIVARDIQIRFALCAAMPVRFPEAWKIKIPMIRK
jgi:hypothetical protein